MKEINDSLIRKKLRDSADCLEKRVPNAEQDRIFLENLEEFSKSNERKSSPIISRWLVAASVVLSVGLTVVYIESPFQEKAEYHELSELIESSNQLEQQLSSYDENSLNARQYAEYIRLRLEIEQIDQQLNERFLSVVT